MKLGIGKCKVIHMGKQNSSNFTFAVMASEVTSTTQKRPLRV